MTAWWTDTGPDTCEFCETQYYAEVGYYCSVCDRPICTTCAVTVYEPRRVICPQCEHEESN